MAQSLVKMDRLRNRLWECQLTLLQKLFTGVAFAPEQCSEGILGMLFQQRMGGHCEHIARKMRRC